MEQAAFLLIKDNLTIIEISLNVGFSNNSSFTKSFKKYFELNPTEFKKKHGSEISKIRRVNSKIGQNIKAFEAYIYDMKENVNWLLTKGKISVSQQDEKYAATIFHIGDIGFEEKFGQLIQWGHKSKTIKTSSFKMGTIYYDSYKITEASKVRKSAFLLVDEPIVEDKNIIPKTIESGNHIVAKLELSISEFPKAYQSIFVWMNENGYTKTDNPPFEIYHNNFNNHPEKKCLVDVFIPIQ